MARRITCIKKDSADSENAYTEISSLGWNEYGSINTQTSTRLEMYNFVHGGGRAFVRDSNGDIVDLVAMISPKGTRYVKTKADNPTSDNLLRLPLCS